MMEANKNIAFYPQNYYDKVNKENKINVNIKHQRHHGHLHRIPSKSITQSVTPYSRPKFSPNFPDESATNNTQTNSKSKSKSNDNKRGSISYHDQNHEFKDEEEITDDIKNIENKKHFNYSPVNRTESTESIKVAYKPKQTFMAKWNSNYNDIDGGDAADDSLNYQNNVNVTNLNNNKNPSKSNLLQKLKSKSSRLLSGKNNKKQNKPSANIQSPDVGLNDLQL